MSYKKLAAIVGIVVAIGGLTAAGYFIVTPYLAHDAPRDSTLVLTAKGLWRGSDKIASIDANDLQLPPVREFKAEFRQTNQVDTVLVRSEVPFGWLRTLLDGLHNGGLTEFTLLIEDPLCREMKSHDSAELVSAGGEEVRARRFDAEVWNTERLAGEFGPDVVGVQPFGIRYVFAGVAVPPGGECDKEIFAFCHRDADPDKFLEGFAKLRGAIRETPEDATERPQKIRAMSRELTEVARRQYPIEDIRSKLRDYSPSVQFEVFDEIPMAVVMEVFDSVAYKRDNPPVADAGTERSADLSRRCSGPLQPRGDVMMLMFSEEFGLTIGEHGLKWSWR